MARQLQQEVLNESLVEVLNCEEIDNYAELPKCS